MRSDVICGSYGDYQWLTHPGLDIGDVVRCGPSIFWERYLAIVSTDSGEPRWWAEKLPGWVCRGGVAYSPRLESFEGILYQVDGPENTGWDEWYTFTEPAEIGEVIRGENRYPGGTVLPWVNHYFLPHEGGDEMRLAMFWGQIERLRPESYISDGCERLTFVSRNRDAFAAVGGLQK